MLLCAAAVLLQQGGLVHAQTGGSPARPCDRAAEGGMYCGTRDGWTNRGTVSSSAGCTQLCVNQGFDSCNAASYDASAQHCSNYQGCSATAADGNYATTWMACPGGANAPLQTCCPNCQPATAGRDLSTGRPASSSSTIGADTPPGKANDGNLGRSHPNEFHSSTEPGHEVEPWWSVQLAERATSPTVTFYARDSSTGDMQHRVQFFLTDSWNPASLDSMTPCLVFTDVQDGSTSSGICEGSGEYLVAASQGFLEIPEIVVTSSGSC